MSAADVIWQGQELQAGGGIVGSVPCDMVSTSTRGVGGGRRGPYQPHVHLIAIKGLVVGALLVGELHPHHHLLLLRQVLHILLHTPKKKGSQLLLYST